MNASEIIRYLGEHRAYIQTHECGPLIGANISENGTGHLIFANGKASFADWKEVEDLCARVKNRIGSPPIVKT